MKLYIIVSTYNNYFYRIVNILYNENDAKNYIDNTTKYYYELWRIIEYNIDPAE